MRRFVTPQSATAHVKRVLRLENISTARVSTSWIHNGREFFTAVHFTADTSDATYSKAVAVLTDEEFTAVSISRDAHFVSCTSEPI